MSEPKNVAGRRQAPLSGSEIFFCVWGGAFFSQVYSKHTQLLLSSTLLLKFPVGKGRCFYLLIYFN